MEPFSTDGALKMSGYNSSTENIVPMFSNKGRKNPKAQHEINSSPFFQPFLFVKFRCCLGTMTVLGIRYRYMTPEVDIV